MPVRTVKVAVIGSGLAGLTAAHLLNKSRECKDVKFEVHVFEKSPLIGMDSASISLPTADHLAENWRIDVPMRSFQGGYYTQLIALYKSLGVQLRQADFSYSFSSLRPASASQDRTITTTFIYNGASGRSGLGKPSSYSPVKGEMDWAAQPFPTTMFLISCLHTILCFLFTLYHSLPIWRAKELRNIALREWVVQVAPTGLLAKLTGMDSAWEDYTRMVLIPTFSAVCTSPAEDIWDHPVEEFLDYIWLTFGTHHYVVVGGVRAVVARLTSNIRHIHLSSSIRALKPDPMNSGCITVSCDIDGVIEEHSGFHHIVFATQASAASWLLSTYLESLPPTLQHRMEKIEPLIHCLQHFESRPSVVINHTDHTLLPDDPRDIRELNLISPLSNDRYTAETSPFHPLCGSPSHTMATHILRRHPAYPKNKPTVYQSTNPLIPPRKDTILSVGKLERAVVTMESKKALASLCREESKKWWQCPYQAETRLGPLQGARPTTEPNAPGIWFCGSYAHLGIPLLEGCVISAQNVVEQGILRSEGVK